MRARSGWEGEDEGEQSRCFCHVANSPEDQQGQRIAFQCDLSMEAWVVDTITGCPRRLSF